MSVNSRLLACFFQNSQMFAHSLQIRIINNQCLLFDFQHSQLLGLPYFLCF